MSYKQGRYSKLIKPLFTMVDLLIVNSIIFLFNTLITNYFFFILYISILWVIISFKNQFYEVQRNTRIVQIITLLFRQIILFSVLVYAFIGFFKQPNISRLALGNYLLAVTILITFFKFFSYFLLSKYRIHLGGNIRNVVVIGQNDKTKSLIEIFNRRIDFGYKFKKQFCIDGDDSSLEICFDFIKENNIDEIYCSVEELSNFQINKLIDFADNNLRELKFIPDNKDIYSKKLKYEYYDYIPILTLRNIPLGDSLNQVIKRAFDILFSAAVIIFLLSWLTPILALLIKLESKGPIFFKQNRPGLNEKGFYCYKFRSMRINYSTEKSATKNDPRVTKIGKFIRKTSLDELPQFYNVLFGDMSVVGPRPHLWRQNEEYGNTVNKYMVRYFVKPGITGLAQSKGFRGEIETISDINSRIRYDVFYIENWSLLLDLKLILDTVRNILKGDDKAY